MSLRAQTSFDFDSVFVTNPAQMSEPLKECVDDLNLLVF